MSRHWTPFKEFRCANDCAQTGCPGHKMRLVYMPSDHVVVEIDPDESARPGTGEWTYIFGEDVFATMVDLEIEARERFAAEKAEDAGRMAAYARTTREWTTSAAATLAELPVDCERKP
jgi:hypothetical protein